MDEYCYDSSVCMRSHRKGILATPQEMDILDRVMCASLCALHHPGAFAVAERKLFLAHFSDWHSRDGVVFFLQSLMFDPKIRPRSEGFPSELSGFNTE